MTQPKRDHVYVFRCADRHMVKIGSGDPVERFKAASVTEDMEWLASVPVPGGARTQELLVHRHFSKHRVKREMFRFEADLVAWVKDLRSRPGVATKEADVDSAYATQGWLPWQGDPLPPIERQQSLAIGDMPERRRRPASEIPTNLAQLSSNSDDWFTPPLYVEAARRVLGGIDLDPASCVEANRDVRADCIYTITDDGLRHEWHGRVWMNPPFGGAQRAFVSHLVDEHERGHVTAAVALLNSNVTDTGWFQPLWRYMLCFTHHRIGFRGPDGAGDGVRSGTVGTVFAYLGPDRDVFAAEFGIFGAIVEARPPLMDRGEFKEMVRAASA